MNKFVVRMLELGAELDKAVSPIEISMVLNDAEILYRNHIEQLPIQRVSKQRELLIAVFEKMNSPQITMLEIGDYDKLADELLSNL